MTTGMDLKVERVKARLTQQQVADRTSLSRSWVAKVENDQEGAVDLDEKVVATYGAALEELGVVRHVEEAA